MKEEKKIAETPLMRQYFSIKTKYPDAILLFRVGDFYETFGEDAIRTAEEKMPDLIISDTALPFLDGFQLCKKIKKQYPAVL